MYKRKFKSNIRTLLYFFAAIGFVVFSFTVNADGTYKLSGKVVRVADGDTITLLHGYKRYRIRLASIDAPETGHGKQRPSQPYSKASRLALAKMVANKDLTLTCYEKDHYQRDICDIPYKDGKTANQALVEQGLAWANMQGGGKYLRDRNLLQLQDQAKEAKLGLWQQPNAVAPWDWRWQCWHALETGQTSPIC